MSHADPGARLPAGVGLSRLSVYDTPGPDGLRGGSAHVHLSCTEGYVVVSGRGMVQTVGPYGVRDVALEPGTVTWFQPGVVHRLVNTGEPLEIVVVMSNGELPEAGDCILSFGADVLASVDAYDAAVALPDRAASCEQSAEPARRRRDRSVDGFLALRAAVERGDDGALKEFYAAAAGLVAHRLDDWEREWRTGQMASAADTGRRIQALRTGDAGALLDAHLYTVGPRPERRRYGMCGMLQTYSWTDGVPP
jgi:mannose-6-phosphate isomerase-like protein (cupin superfamily)